MTKNNLRFLAEILEPLNLKDTFEKQQEHIENILCKFLNTKTVVAFIGAGVSIPLGYPAWWKFTDDMFNLLDVTLIIEGSNKCLAESLFDVENVDANVFKKIFLIDKDSDDFCVAEDYKTLLQKLIKDGYLELADKLKEVSKNYNSNKDKFKEFQNYLKEKKSKELDFQTIFSECELLLCSDSEWQEKKQSKFFRILVKSYFQIKRLYATKKNKTKLSTKDNNPYLALLDLPIKKFATFNYDLEIERAIIHRNKNYNSTIYNNDITCEQVIQKINKLTTKSFSQKKEFCEQLADFSLSRYEDSFDAVFHCHGRIDDTENCVVSEEDYQKWYLREDNEEFTPFRQTLDITLDSNPILFMGFSLNDPDFMRILRTITANRPHVDKTRNPLFCLMYVLKNEIREDTDRQVNEEFDRKNGDLRNILDTKLKEINADSKLESEQKQKSIIKLIEQKQKDTLKLNKDKYEALKENDNKAKWTSHKELEDECKALYIKYGLHVIPVKEKDNSDTTKEAICNKLIKIKGQWEKWWQGIVQKPAFRKFEVKRDEPYFHYKFKIDDNSIIQSFDFRLHTDLDISLGFKEIKSQKHGIEETKNNILQKNWQ